VPSADVKSAPRADGLHVSLADHMSTVTFKLALSDEEKKVTIASCQSHLGQCW